MPVLVKRLARNELGYAGGHQRGGVLIPKSCTGFFPPLSAASNPEASIAVKFAGLSTTTTLRVVYYQQGTRNEYRLTPIPHEVLRNAAAGDFLVLNKNADNRIDAEIVKWSDSRHAMLNRRVGGAAGIIAPFLPTAT